MVEEFDLVFENGDEVRGLLLESWEAELFELDLLLSAALDELFAAVDESLELEQSWVGDRVWCWVAFLAEELEDGSVEGIGLGVLLMGACEVTNT